MKIKELTTMKTKIEKSSRKNREEEFLKSCTPAKNLNLDLSLNLYADDRFKNAFSMPMHFLSDHRKAIFSTFRSKAKQFYLQLVFENSIIPMIQKETKLLYRKNHSWFTIPGEDDPGFKCKIIHYSGKNLETVYEVDFLILDRQRMHKTLKQFVG